MSAGRPAPEPAIPSGSSPAPPAGTHPESASMSRPERLCPSHPVPPPAGRPTFGLGSRWGPRADLVVGAALAFYVLVVANIIIFRHPCRIDLTQEGELSLSRSTLDRLALLREEILVVIPTYLQANQPEHLAEREVLGRARNLLNAYVAAQPLVKIAAEVDVIARPERWKEVQAEFDLTVGQFNRFIFIAGADRAFRQAVAARDMATFRAARDPAIAMPEITGFRAEMAMTDAIWKLVKRDKRAVYFTQDHGELRLRPESGQRAAGALNAVSRELLTHGMEARSLSLSTAGAIPGDAKAVVVAGPMTRFSPDEKDRLRRYLNGGGSLLVALGPATTGIEDLLAEWAVEVQKGRIRGLRVSEGTRAATEWIPARKFDPTHPVTAPFTDVPGFEVLMFGPRALDPGGLGKGRAATPILRVEPADRGEAYYIVEEGGSIVGKRPGAFPVAIAVEQLVPERPPPGFQRVEFRLLVLGSADFLDDASFIRASNRDFFLDGMLWLLGEEAEATAGGSPWARSILPGARDPARRSFLLWVPVVILPGVFLALGAFVYLLRRQ